MSYNGVLTETRTILHEGIKGVLIAFLASALISLAAPIAIFLPFSPVPLALQMNVILFLAAALGAQRAALMVGFFLLQGALGFPVFAGGNAGAWILVGPRAGYLFGYLVAAFVVGSLQERSTNRSALHLFFHMAIGNAIVYIMGAAWLAQFIGGYKALLCGIVPFIPGDLLKLFVFSKMDKIRALNASL